VKGTVCTSRATVAGTNGKEHIMLKSALAIILAAAALPAAAHAQQDEAPRSVTVVYSDLNLESEEGVRILNSRIKGALDRVCGSPQQGTLRERMDSRSCQNSAQSGAAAQRSAVLARARLQPISIASAG
jgi:UrcA family protein